MINLTMLLITLTAQAGTFTHELAELEIKCLADVDIKKLEKDMKRFGADNLTEPVQEELAHYLVNSEILTCIERKINK
jgi:hypothetical protein